MNYSGYLQDNEGNKYYSGIVESGSNNKGEYVKFSDGTMICSREIDITFDVSIQWGSLFVGEDTYAYDFAQEFIEAPKVITNIRNTTSSSLIPAYYRKPNITKRYYQNFSVVRPTSSNSVPAIVTIIAIGKWK